MQIKSMLRFWAAVCTLRKHLIESLSKVRKIKSDSMRKALKDLACKKIIQSVTRTIRRRGSTLEKRLDCEIKNTSLLYPFIESSWLGQNIWAAKKTILHFSESRLQRLDLAMKMRKTHVKVNTILLTFK